ncbi:hypothetical protein BSPWISOXPB_1898 [uncultured Gammaproteobacteria bacterium]|nr:hypothetical protein BSPWISOXPB_1898 [uncultured Gammaproteobacteria bacterium]
MVGKMGGFGLFGVVFKGRLMSGTHGQKQGVPISMSERMLAKMEYKHQGKCFGLVET